MAIHQLRIRYLPEEDRMVLDIATTDQEEFMLLLTRRFVKMLLPVIRKSLENEASVKEQKDPRAKQAVLGFQHQEQVAKANFEKKYTEKPQKKPLGEKALLGHRLRVKPLKQGATLAVYSKEGKGIEMNMNHQMLHSFHKLLMDAIRRAEWDISSDISILPLAQDGTTKH